MNEETTDFLLKVLRTVQQQHADLHALHENRELYIFTHGEEAFKQAEQDCFPNQDNPDRYIEEIKSKNKNKKAPPQDETGATDLLGNIKKLK
jgi:hypothetical protein